MTDYKLVPVGRVKTVGGYPDESEHTVEWLCKYKDLKDGDLLYTAPQPAEQQSYPFRGDNAALIHSAQSLLSLDDKGALSPNGIGGHARNIIKAFIARFSAEQQSAQDVAGLVDALEAIERMDYSDHAAEAVLVARSTMTAHRNGPLIERR